MTVITQSELAKMAGVSRATVGRVINNCDDVNPETRKKIQDLIEQYGYRPNRAGQALVIQQKKIKIGCIMIESDNAFFSQLNSGILQKAEEFKQYGIEVLSRNVPFESKAQIEQIDSLLEEEISALVIQPTIDQEVCAKLKELEESGIPIVTVNTDLPNYQSSFCYVGNDFYMCGKTAANLMQLLTNANCNIGIVTGFSKAKSHSDRIDGFRDYIQAFPNMNIIAIVESHDDDMESYYEVRTILKEYPQINALFLVAGGVYGAGKAIRAETLHTDRKIMTISFDDLPTTRNLVKEGIITATICQQPIRQGKMAMSVLFDYLIEGKAPVNNRLYTDIQIKLAANIDSNYEENTYY